MQPSSKLPNYDQPHFLQPISLPYESCPRVQSYSSFRAVAPFIPWKLVFDIENFSSFVCGSATKLPERNNLKTCITQA